MRSPHFLFVAILTVISFGTKGNADRLNYLNEPCDPYYVGTNFPKLITPQWIGEAGVDAVVILSIDDMRDPKRYESYLRPILDRLRQIDGHAPLSIFTNQVDPADPQLQAWLNEGLSIEVHTVDHPCPLLKDDDFDKAKSTYDRCVDMLSRIEGTHPVAFRMPCCDSLNTPSPRFYNEIFNSQTSNGRFLEIDSSVFNIFNDTDKQLPKEIVRRNTEERFQRYLPFPSFVNTIENYPYPYIIGRLCWEFPCVVPSDWEAQNLHRPFNPVTVEDLKAAIDATVIKQGIMPIVFHPHGWIRNEQIVELIEYSQQRYRGRVKFMTFPEALKRINQNLLDGGSIRDEHGGDNGVRLVDINHDGFIDVVSPTPDGLVTKVWQPEAKKWLRVDTAFHATELQFGLLKSNVLLSAPEKGTKRWRIFDWSDKHWVERDFTAGQSVDPRWGQLIKEPSKLDDLRWKDIDEDGTSELLLSKKGETILFQYDKEKRFQALPFDLPHALVDEHGSDAGLRFRDIDGDGLDDVVFSNGKNFGVWLFDSLEKGWIQSPVDGDRPIPAIVRGDGTNNGAWFHSEHLWVQNENTARLPNLVDRMAYRDLLGKNALDSDSDSDSDSDTDEFPGPTSADDALTTFQTLEGFRVELVAAEPHVIDPVAFDWGPDGRLWVAEMSDYPNGGTWNGPNDPLDEPGGRVRVLTDPDGDGRFDRSQVFLDGLTVPTGVKAWRNGVLVVAAPKIFFAEDTTGDGKADRMQTLFEGLGQGNQQHRANGLRWGLDHWLHVANGDSGGKVISTQTGQEVAIRGHDFMINPDHGRIERVFGQTQFGRSRDDVGNWFGGNNSNPSWHYVLEEKYVDRNPHFIPASPRRSLPEVPGAAPVFPISKTLTRFNDFDRANRFTSACSPEIFRDTFRSGDPPHIYVCEPVHNLVNRQIMESTGVSYLSRRANSESNREFLASTDSWFRPVMTRTGPDGALWVADMYRLVIEHPEWIPMAWQKKLDLRAGRDRGRIYRVVSTNPPNTSSPYPRWDRLNARDSKELVELLAHHNGTLRDMVHQILYWRNDAESIEPLKNLLAHSKEPVTQIHALYLLHHFHALSDLSLANAMTRGPADLGRHAMRIADARFKSSPTLQDALLTAFRTQQTTRADRQLQLQLACSLGAVANPKSGEVLAKIAIKNANDQHILTAVLSSLNAMNLNVFVRELQDLATDATNEPSPLLANQAFMQQLLSSVVGFDAPKICLGILENWSAKQGDQHFVVFNGIMRALRQHDRTPESFFGRESNDEFQRILKHHKELAADASMPLAQRLQSIGAFDTGQPLDDRDKTLLLPLCGADQPIGIQQRAIEILAATGDEGVLTELVSRWESFTPTLQNQLTTAIFSRETSIKILLEAIANGAIQPNQISARRRNDLFSHRNPQISELANRLLARAASDRDAVVERYAKADHRSGDSNIGRAIFQKNCSACHQLGGIGRDVGPNLMALSDKSIHSLLTAILAPNKAVEDKYLEYIVVTKGGKQVSGVISQETENAITLATPDGKNASILRSQVEMLKATGRSFMPVGLEQEVAIDQMKHLLAFVRDFRAPAKQFPGNTPRVAPVRNDGSIRLFSMYANIYGASLVFEPTYRNLGFWSSTDDQATWSINSPRGGVFSVRLDYACPDSEAGGQFQIQVAGKKIVGTVKPTGGWNNYQGMSVGTIELPKGESELTIQSFGRIDGYLMDLRTIILYPK